jgi:beta-hydroxylase
MQEIFEAHWLDIRNEYLLIQDKLNPWVEHHLYEGAWDVFGIFDFPDGNEIKENSQYCPILTDLIKSHLPNHGAVGFSRLAPNTIINPHKGYQGEYLRMHLGLIIPEGDCALESEGTIYTWAEGKTFVFDDRKTHSAWNHTNKERISLIVDYIP